MTTLRKRFWLWLGKVLRVENGGVIDHGYTAPANQIPVVVSPDKELFVKDPFKISEHQRLQAREKFHELHLERVYRGESSFSKEKEAQQDILHAIDAATYSQRKFNGSPDSHWDGCSTRAIDLLQSLGFRDNADIQRYLRTGELPHDQ